jgi:hypothetical protein
VKSSALLRVGMVCSPEQEAVFRPESHGNKAMERFRDFVKSWATPGNPGLRRGSVGNLGINGQLRIFFSRGCSCADKKSLFPTAANDRKLLPARWAGR